VGARKIVSGTIFSSRKNPFVFLRLRCSRTRVNPVQSHRCTAPRCLIITSSLSSASRKGKSSSTSAHPPLPFAHGNNNDNGVRSRTRYYTHEVVVGRHPRVRSMTIYGPVTERAMTASARRPMNHRSGTPTTGERRACAAEPFVRSTLGERNGTPARVAQRPRAHAEHLTKDDGGTVVGGVRWGVGEAAPRRRRPCRRFVLIRSSSSSSSSSSAVVLTNNNNNNITSPSSSLSTAAAAHVPTTRPPDRLFLRRRVSVRTALDGAASRDIVVVLLW